MERKPIISKLDTLQIGASVALGNAIWIAAEIGLKMESPSREQVFTMYQEGGINSRLVLAAAAALAFHVIQETTDTKPKP